MSRNTTLLKLRTQSRLRADKVNSGFILDSELNQYVNNSITELYDLLVGAYGNDYYLKKYQFSTDGINSEFALPADFYKLEGIDLNVNASNFITLKPYMFNERARFQNGSNWSANSMAQGPRYHLKASTVDFVPTPSVNALTMYYIPASPELIGDSDTFDGINGWEEYVVVDAAIKMLQKEESDVSVLAAQKQALVLRINAMAENRDMGHSFKVQDVQQRYNDRFMEGY